MAKLPELLELDNRGPVFLDRVSACHSVRSARVLFDQVARELGRLHSRNEPWPGWPFREDLEGAAPTLSEAREATIITWWLLYHDHLPGELTRWLNALGEVEARYLARVRPYLESTVARAEAESRRKRAGGAKGAALVNAERCAERRDRATLAAEVGKLMTAGRTKTAAVEVVASRKGVATRTVWNALKRTP